MKHFVISYGTGFSNQAIELIDGYGISWLIAAVGNGFKSFDFCLKKS